MVQNQRKCQHRAMLALQIFKIYSILKMVVLERITSIIYHYHVNVCSTLHFEQQLFRAIKNLHFSTYV